MTPLSWPCPSSSSATGTATEYALAVEAKGPQRLLIVPALFDEGNRMRRFTVELMRRLAEHGVASVLPDLPGSNESLQPLITQTAQDWDRAMQACAGHFAATATLGIRGGALFTPRSTYSQGTPLPAIHYAPVSAASILRQMIRARIIASREAGHEETRDGLARRAENEGITLAGYRLSAAFVASFQAREPDPAAHVITQGMLGASGLWLRSEPGENAEQARTLAALLARRLDAPAP